MEKHLLDFGYKRRAEPDMGNCITKIKKYDNPGSSRDSAEVVAHVAHSRSGYVGGRNKDLSSIENDARFARQTAAKFYFCGGGRNSFENLKLENPLSISEIHDILNSEKLSSWVGAVFKTKSQNLKDYLFVKDVGSVGSFVLVRESNDDDIYHVHCLMQTVSRTDKIRNSLLNLVPNMIICKLQKVKYFPSLFRYVVKNPIEFASNDIFLCNTAFSIPYHEALVWESDDSKNMAPIARDITRLMETTGACNTEELMREAPGQMAKYLHKTNLSTIVDNCRTWLSKPGNNDLSEIEANFAPSPINIHKILVYQNIKVEEFDSAFHSWFVKRDTKKNTLIIQGPSNTGKSSFTRPLMSMFNYAEIQNGTAFMFQNCPNKELLLWEEPLVSPDQADKCKLVFERVTTHVSVKYKDAKCLYRTPVLITTNKNIWHYCSAEESPFLNRSYIFYFYRQIQQHPEMDQGSPKSCDCAFCGSDSVDGLRIRYTKSTDLDITIGKMPDDPMRPVGPPHDSESTDLDSTCSIPPDDPMRQCVASPQDKEPVSKCSNASGDNLMSETTISDWQHYISYVKSIFKTIKV